nr:hypothetical protein [Candidatus Sigynarchaeota archaeon]
MHVDHCGWQVGITYQSGRPGGLDHAYMRTLLHEMASHRMNLLSIMMQSYAYYDPQHDGYAWPCQNPKLAWYRDTAAVNAQPGAEFLHSIIDEARDIGIEIELFLNWGIWNKTTTAKAYPGVQGQVDASGRSMDWLQCPDAPDSWQLGIDEMNDLLSFYHHPNVTRFAFERVGYAGKTYCYCPHSQAAFQADRGSTMKDATARQLAEWKQQHITELLRAYVARVKAARPEIHVGIHSRGEAAWGHDPARFKDVGIEFVEPHVAQHKTSKAELHANWDRLAPNLCILHFDARDNAPVNYPIWRKEPRIIEKIFGWVEQYYGNNLSGILFFNEPAVSLANKRCVYKIVDTMQISR